MGHKKKNRFFIVTILSIFVIAPWLITDAIFELAGCFEFIGYEVPNIS